ncbi:hypothetical protein O181_054985 [Austropuccinia psidii MF-1]|uniref:Uncharacterized protein n=1 Tax=Austropuccinia psidii MF-1 TaxID=1389203 RepID=A0A9Q3E9U7_9BASI|nr:hypothetical protein [Austropuccinia psidii MF-1]
MEYTGSEVFSGNTTVNFSSESIISPACKPNTLKNCSKEIETNTIKTNNNPSNNTKPTISNFVGPLRSNQYETNTNKGYIKKEQMSRPTTSCASSRINENEIAMIDTTTTEYEEETVLIKILNYIERKIINQPISTKKRYQKR